MTNRSAHPRLQRLEPRDLPSAGLTRIAPGDPFAGSTADNVSGQPGSNFPSSQVEPTVAANPARANNLVAAWQQDRWSNGGARGVVVGVSNDAGNHWTDVTLPGITAASGGEFLRATDPWLSFASDGTLYASTLAYDPDLSGTLPYPFDSTRSAILVSKSADGGLTWGAPTTLIDDPSPQFPGGYPFLAFNDKDTVTVDPNNPNDVYVTWTRTSYNLLTGEFRGPAYFARTTDGGQTWEAAKPIYDPGSFSEAVGGQIVVLPDGTLVDVFAEGSETSLYGSVRAIRSTDHGATWSAPVTLVTGAARVLFDPETGLPVRSGEAFPEVAADPRTGAVYVVTQALDLPGGSALDGIALFTSTDGGQTWSAPITINQTPAGLPAANRQVFDPSIHVASDGTVAVTYYDFRNNTPASGFLADYWAVFANPNDPRNLPGGLTNPANWGGELRLTPQSFDVELAPGSTNANPGLFLGDYQALTAVGNRFVTVFAVAGTEGAGTAGVYARWFQPTGASGHTPGDKPAAPVGSSAAATTGGTHRSAVVPDSEAPVLAVFASDFRGRARTALAKYGVDLDERFPLDEPA